MDWRGILSALGELLRRLFGLEEKESREREEKLERQTVETETENRELRAEVQGKTAAEKTEEIRRQRETEWANATEEERKKILLGTFKRD